MNRGEQSGLLHLARTTGKWPLLTCWRAHDDAPAPTYMLSPSFSSLSTPPFSPVWSASLLRMVSKLVADPGGSWSEPCKVVAGDNAAEGGRPVCSVRSRSALLSFSTWFSSAVWRWRSFALNLRASFSELWGGKNSQRLRPRARQGMDVTHSRWLDFTVRTDGTTPSLSTVATWPFFIALRSHTHTHTHIYKYI